MSLNFFLIFILIPIFAQAFAVNIGKGLGDLAAA